MSALPEDSDSWAQCRQKAPVVAAAELQKQKILCLFLCLPDFWLILEKVTFLTYNATEICRNYVTNSEWDRAVRDQEREVEGEPLWRKQRLQVAGARLSSYHHSLSSYQHCLLQVISWGNNVHMPALQAHTGLGGHSRAPSLHSLTSAEGTTAHSREPAGCWQSLQGFTWVMPDIPNIYWYYFDFKIAYL